MQLAIDTFVSGMVSLLSARAQHQDREMESERGMTRASKECVSVSVYMPITIRLASMLMHCPP